MNSQSKSWTSFSNFLGEAVASRPPIRNVIQKVVPERRKPWFALALTKLNSNNIPNLSLAASGRQPIHTNRPGI